MVKVDVHDMSTLDDPRFERFLELLNKTNQFNTTGRRWERKELVDFVSTGGKLMYADVEDKYTSYGLTGAVLYRDYAIDQLVVSCRVFGLGVENELLRKVQQQVGKRRLYVRFGSTGRNGPALQYLSQMVDGDLLSGGGLLRLATGTADNSASIDTIP
jgi:predicted enzyme involved in methoxymalonyl-ACP biosynthesis